MEEGSPFPWEKLKIITPVTGGQIFFCNSCQTSLYGINSVKRHWLSFHVTSKRFLVKKIGEKPRSDDVTEKMDCTN